MHVRIKSLAALLATALTLAAGGLAVAQVTSTNVAFPRGATSTVVSATLKGDQIRDYVVRASAGQTMKVTMSGSSILFFNVLPPGSNDEAIFTGSVEGNSFAGTLSQSGPYKIRVYQMRASARRGETGSFKMNIAVTGKMAASAHPSVAGGGLAGIGGMNSIKAIDTMTSRGFANVDSFDSGNTQYGIFYNRATHVCAQLTMADGKVLDARDIKTHPKCR